MIRILTATIFLISISQHATAQTWNCRNTAIEVSCTKGKCEVSQAHTPMDVSFSLAGEMKICAYTGCWLGKPKSVLVSGRYLTLTGDDLRWSHGSNTSGVEGSVTIDTSKGTAVIMIENFAQPMSCEKTAQPK